MNSPRFLFTKLLILALLIGTGALIYMVRPSADSLGCPVIDQHDAVTDKLGLATLRVNNQITPEIPLGTDVELAVNLEAPTDTISLNLNPISIVGQVKRWTPQAGEQPGLVVNQTSTTIGWSSTQGLLASGTYTVVVSSERTSEDRGVGYSHINNGVGFGFKWLRIRGGVGPSSLQHFFLVRDHHLPSVTLTGPANLQGTAPVVVGVTMTRNAVVEQLTVTHASIASKPVVLFTNETKQLTLTPDGSGQDVTLTLATKSWCGNASQTLVIPAVGSAGGNPPATTTPPTASPPVTTTETTLPVTSVTPTPTTSNSSSMAASTAASVSPAASTSPTAESGSASTVASPSTPSSTATSAESTSPAMSPTPSSSDSALPDPVTSSSASQSPAAGTTQAPTVSSTLPASIAMTPVTSTSPSAVTTSSSPNASLSATSPATANPAITTRAPETSDTVQSVRIAGQPHDLAEPVTVTAGTPIQVGVVQGTAAPGETVTVYVYSEPSIYTVTADANGHWSLEIPTTELETGEHRIEYETPSQSKTELMKFTVAAAATESLAPPRLEAVSETPSLTMTDATLDQTREPTASGPPLWAVVVGAVVLLIIIAAIIIVLTRRHNSKTMNELPEDKKASTIITN